MNDNNLDSENLKLFRKNLDYFSLPSSINESKYHEFVHKRSRIFMIPGMREDTIVFKTLWDKVVTSSKVIKGNIETIRRNEDKFKKNITNLINYFDFLMNATNFFMIEMSLKSISFDFENFISALFTIFTYKKNLNTGDSLTKFIEIADFIRKDPNFANTPLGMLNRYAKYPKDMFKALHIDSVITDEDLEGLNFSSSFFALAAPSFEGKTQFAFVLDSVRPLYFALGQHSIGNRSPQQIYLNFESLNKAIQTYAEKDIKIMKSLLGNPENEQLEVGTELISEIYLTKHSSWVLGFLAALIVDAVEHFKPQTSPWMKFHAERKDLNIVPVTIKGFQEMPLVDYCIFLDEFLIQDWAVLIRNFARIVQLPIFLANTNTAIANITGKAHSSSRDEPNGVWSVVVTRLNSANWEALNKTFKVEDAFARLIRLNGNQRFKADFLKEFYRILVGQEIRFVRSGIAFYLVKAFSSYLQSYRSSTFDLSKFISYLFEKLSEEIQNRKTKIVTTNDGLLAQIGLLTPISYVKDDVKDTEDKFHRIAFLRDHLFYLINPSNNSNWAFFTLRPKAEGKPLRIYQALSITDWMHEITFFRAEDDFTALACIFIVMKRPVASILQEANGNLIRSAVAISDADNDEAIELNGNSLEVIAAVSIIDASHHGLDSKTSTLCGQDGLTFMSNIVQNLISDIHYEKSGTPLRFQEQEQEQEHNKRTRTRELELEQTSTSTTDPIRDLLKSIWVPFLFPYNCDVSKFMNFLSSSTVSESAPIRLGKYERTANKTEIDGKFPIFKISSVDNVVPSFSNDSIVVECKNWQKKLGSGDIHKILMKAHKKKPCSISFIFCTKMIDSPQIDTILYNYCKAKATSVLLYRIVPYKNHLNQFQFVKFFPDLHLKKPPTLTCFVVELDIIQNMTT